MARVLYGIKNCDSVKKARSWLQDRQIDYRFHDYRVDGLNAELLGHFIDTLGLEVVLNRKSTSWRQLTAEQKSDLTPDKAIQLLLAMPTLIKRPIFENGEQMIAGFHPDLYLPEA